ncbi:MAG: DUF1353 domain-containing protein [Dehalococcoidia bacterium]
MSEFTEILLVSPLADGKTWVIQKQFTYYVGELGSAETITVPVGFQTDFASVPRPFWPLVPKWGKYGKAAIIHDYCYWEQHYTRKRTDEIFREAMGVLGVAPWRVILMYWAVRLFARGAWRGNQKRRQQGKNRVVEPPQKAAEPRQW